MLLHLFYKIKRIIDIDDNQILITSISNSLFYYNNEFYDNNLKKIVNKCVYNKNFEILHFYVNKYQLNVYNGFISRKNSYFYTSLSRLDSLWYLYQLCHNNLFKDIKNFLKKFSNPDYFINDGICEILVRYCKYNQLIEILKTINNRQFVFASIKYHKNKILRNIINNYQIIRIMFVKAIDSKNYTALNILFNNLKNVNLTEGNKQTLNYFLKNKKYNNFFQLLCIYLKNESTFDYYYN